MHRTLLAATVVVCGISVSGIAVAARDERAAGGHGAPPTAAIAMRSSDVPAAQAASSSQAAPAANVPSGTSLRIANAQVQPVAASSPIASQFRTLVERQVEPAWIAYTQPIAASEAAGCCWGWQNDGSGCCGGCPLESRPGVTSITEHRGDGRPVGPGPIKLEGSTELVLLFRVEARALDRVRVFSADCALDAGGRVVHLLTGVRPADSIAFLESQIASGLSTTRKSGADSLVMALALHKDPAADAALGRLLAPSQPESVRRKAMFWTARARGRAGFEVVRRLMRDDPSPSVRKEAVGALAQSREADVVPALIDAARTGPDADVRGQALFWLAQKAGRQAEETLTRAIADDPETKVKERAVFAISQLPKERSVPLLIDVAKTNRNPAVRKRAMFWLGQSDDPRALAFFESVLR